MANFIEVHYKIGICFISKTQTRDNTKEKKLEEEKRNPDPTAGIVVGGANVERLEDVASNGSVSKNLTFDASPLFTATIATTSPLDLSTPNIVPFSCLGLNWVCCNTN